MLLVSHSFQQHFRAELEIFLSLLTTQFFGLLFGWFKMQNDTDENNDTMITIFRLIRLVSVPYIIIISVVGVGGNILTILTMRKRSLTRNFNNCTLIALGKSIGFAWIFHLKHSIFSCYRFSFQFRFDFPMYYWSCWVQSRYNLPFIILFLASGWILIGMFYSTVHCTTFYSCSFSIECVRCEENTSCSLLHCWLFHRLRIVILLRISQKQSVWRLSRRIRVDLVCVRCDLILFVAIYSDYCS